MTCAHQSSGAVSAWASNLDSDGVGGRLRTQGLPALGARGSVVVQVKDWSLIAVEGVGEQRMAYIQVADNPIDVVVEPPVGTVIFSALTARRLYASSNSPPGGGKGAGGTEPLDQFLRDLHRSFAFSLKFIKDDQIRFDPVRVWHPAKDSPRLNVRDAVEDKPASREAWHVEPWDLKKRE